MGISILIYFLCLTTEIITQSIIPEFLSDHEITGTFKFKKISVNGSRSGWNIRGCYCPGDRLYCDCNYNRNRIRLQLGQRGYTQRLKQTGNRLRDVRQRITRNNINQRRPEQINRPLYNINENRNNRRPRRKIIRKTRKYFGCFCNTNGCHGRTCDSLNGCVCDTTGKCWGLRCQEDTDDSAINNDEKSTEITNEDIKRELEKLQVELTIQGIERLRNQIVNRNLASSSESKYIANKCHCNQNIGCIGDCAELNGCVCVKGMCWGLHCDSGSLELDSNSIENKINMLKTHLNQNIVDKMKLLEFMNAQLKKASHKNNKNNFFINNNNDENYDYNNIINDNNIPNFHNIYNNKAMLENNLALLKNFASKNNKLSVKTNGSYFNRGKFIPIIKSYPVDTIVTVPIKSAKANLHILSSTDNNEPSAILASKTRNNDLQEQTKKMNTIFVNNNNMMPVKTIGANKNDKFESDNISDELSDQEWKVSKEERKDICMHSNNNMKNVFCGN